MSNINTKILLFDSPNSQGWARLISRMNQSIASSLSSSGFNVSCCGTLSSFAISTLRSKDIVVLSEASSWSALFRFFRLRCHTSILVEHHYSRGFVDYIVQNRGKSAFIFNSMLRLSYSFFDYVVAVSYGQAKWMSKQKLLPERKIVIIPSVSSVDKLLLLSPPRFNRNELVVGLIGRFVPQKGFDLLLDALHMLSHIPLRIVIAGDGPDRVKYLDAALDYPQVQFVGVVDDVSNFYSLVDVVLVPSRWEPFGTVALEAKASARPILVSNIDGLSEQVTDCGIAFPSSTIGVAQAIQDFYHASIEQKNSWSRNARQQASRAEDAYFSSWRHLAQLITS